MKLPTVTPPQPDRRKNIRMRVLLRGLVCDSAGGPSYSCAIRELTQGGARIAIPEGRTVSPEICLINVRERVAYDAILLWQNHVEAGFALLNTMALSRTGEARNRHLYELCVGSAAMAAGLDEV